MALARRRGIRTCACFGSESNSGPWSRVAAAGLGIPLLFDPNPLLSSTQQLVSFGVILLVAASLEVGRSLRHRLFSTFSSNRDSSEISLSRRRLLYAGVTASGVVGFMAILSRPASAAMQACGSVASSMLGAATPSGIDTSQPQPNTSYNTCVQIYNACMTAANDNYDACEEQCQSDPQFCRDQYNNDTQRCETNFQNCAATAT